MVEFVSRAMSDFMSQVMDQYFASILIVGYATYMIVRSVYHTMKRRVRVHKFPVEFTPPAPPEPPSGVEEESSSERGGEEEQDQEGLEAPPVPPEQVVQEPRPEVPRPGAPPVLPVQAVHEPRPEVPRAPVPHPRIHSAASRNQCGCIVANARVCSSFRRLLSQNGMRESSVRPFRGGVFQGEAPAGSSEPMSRVPSPSSSRLEAGASAERKEKVKDDFTRVERGPEKPVRESLKYEDANHCILILLVNLC